MDELVNNPNATPELVDKAFEAVGVSQRSATEFTSKNMGDFNNVAEDIPNVDYYSIGA